MGILGDWQRVRVTGYSMTPTLRDGDVVLVRRGVRVRPGDLVLASFRTGLDGLVLKRVERACDGGWILTSDNGRAGSDSRVYGVAEAHARVCWIWNRRLRGLHRGPLAAVRAVIGHGPDRQPPADA